MKYLIIAFCAMLIIFLFLPIKISIRLVRRNEDDYVELGLILLFGLLNLKFKIPFIDVTKKGNRLFVQIKDLLEKGKDGADILKDESSISINKIVSNIKKARKNKELFMPILRYMKKKIEILELKWDSKLGLSDAAVTGIATGGLWAIKYLIVSMVSINKSIKDVHINVISIFNDLVFETDFYCIIKFKIVYIITAGLIGIRVKIKGGV